MSAEASSSQGSPFWRFSLRFYRQPKVADACIALQEEAGVDVNLLLFLLWHATLKRTLSVLEVERAGRAHRRLARRHRHPAAGGAARAEVAAGAGRSRRPRKLFRTKIKAIELEAERLQQEAMYELARPSPLGREAASADEAARSQYRSLRRRSRRRHFQARQVETLLAAFAGLER